MKRMAEIINLLGRKPKSTDEYDKAYQFLFRTNGDYKSRLKEQRRRHLAHTGPRNINRRPCIFCND